MTIRLTARSLTATLALTVSVLLTCGAAPMRAQEVLEGPAPEAVVLEGTLSEYFIYLPQLSGAPGTVRFVVQNIGQRPHNLRVVGNGVDRVTPDLRGGESGDVEVYFVDSGPYTVYCDIGDHADRGMTTSFYVEAPLPALNQS